jgi:alkanesulfonate monooxygenase SsuD/methylene tetrahydromethanopterin reductase-like flavin-dependent oxidoreductase (luciferase family)
MEEALAIYRSMFRPSALLEKPHAMLGLNVVAADTDEEAQRLFTSIQQAFINLRTGRPGQLPPPVDPASLEGDPMHEHLAREVFSRAVVGSPETVQKGLQAFVQRTGADEVMVTAQVFDHAARLRSFELTAKAWTAAQSQAAAV